LIETSTPTPPVSSRTSAAVLSPASTVSVAPNSRALSSRNLFESIAMTREAPHRPVVRMAASADARQRYNNVIGDSPV
jgi:hypothetical protein